MISMFIMLQLNSKHICNLKSLINPNHRCNKKTHDIFKTTKFKTKIKTYSDDSNKSIQLWYLIIFKLLL